MAQGLSGTGLVLGGGVAGLLAASVLAENLGVATIVERDRFAVARRGAPQGRHAHLLLGSGASVVDTLLPGTVDALLDRGARRIGMPEDIFTLTPQGWMPRFPSVQFLISVSRALLEDVLRKRVLADRRVTLVEGADVIGLTGNVSHVDGALARDRATGETRRIDANLVVDATGSGSKILRWLDELGIPTVPEEVVDPRVGYATREFRRPAELCSFPAVFIQPAPGISGNSGVVLPIEANRWIVSLSARGSIPPTAADDFRAFARSLRHPLIADLIAAAEPLTPARGFRASANRWRRFDKLPRWPEGLVVMGDALCSFNPLYGHGMSVAAFEAYLLRKTLREHGHAGTAQAVLPRAVADAWSLAVGQDMRYKETLGPRMSILDHLRNTYADGVGRTAAVNPTVAASLLRSYTLSAPLSDLLTPRLVLASLLRSGRPASEPPLRAHETELLAEVTESRRPSVDEPY